jgi:uncharacterized protein
MTTDRCKTYRRHKSAHEAYVRGDLKALRDALGNPPDFPNCRQPFDMAVGDHPLEYAIYWSPAAFVAELIRLGADPNYPDPAGFPPLIAAVSARRPDCNEILKLLWKMERIPHNEASMIGPRCISRLPSAISEL